MALTRAPEIEKLIAEKVESGLYTSPDEVVAAGLKLLEQRDSDRNERLAALREETAVGLRAAERGEIAPFDMEEIRAEMRRRRDQAP